MVLIDRSSASMASVDLSRLPSRLENQGNYQALSLPNFVNTHEFTHKGHFWNTTFKPYSGRPKEHPL